VLGSVVVAPHSRTTPRLPYRCRAGVPRPHRSSRPDGPVF
jgi:hypothetical protein